MTKKIVLFNGPPGAGKDFASRILRQRLNVRHMHMAEWLKEFTHHMYGISHRTWDAFEDVKDIASPLFNGLTPRAAYIDAAENVLKPRFGLEVMAERCSQECFDLWTEDNLFANSSLGFDYEINPFIRKFRLANVMVVHMVPADWPPSKYRQYHEEPFPGDSRKFVWRPDLFEQGLKLGVIFNAKKGADSMQDLLVDAGVFEFLRG